MILGGNVCSLSMESDIVQMKLHQSFDDFDQAILHAVEILTAFALIANSGRRKECKAVPQC